MKMSFGRLFILMVVVASCGFGRSAHAMLNSQLGRFMQQDPLGYVDGGCQYQDERSNTVSHSDPFGLLVTVTMSEGDYWDQWVKQHPGLTPQQYADARKTLDRGCIGVTALALGTSSNPDSSHCFIKLEEAKAERVQWEKDRCENKPDSCAKSRLFSIHFFDNDPAHTYKPNPTNKRVDMSVWNYKSAGATWYNFDYALFEQGAWRHANHKAPGMEVYIDDLNHWSHDGHDTSSASGDYWVGYKDFNHQVFCVACAKDW